MNLSNWTLEIVSAPKNLCRIPLSKKKCGLGGHLENLCTDVGLHTVTTIPVVIPFTPVIIDTGMDFKIYSGIQILETQRKSKLQQQRWNLCIPNFISHFICLGQYLQRGTTEYPHIQRCNACGITPQRTGVWNSCQRCWHFYFTVKNKYFYCISAEADKCVVNINGPVGLISAENCNTSAAAPTNPNPPISTKTCRRLINSPTGRLKQPVAKMSIIMS